MPAPQCLKLRLLVSADHELVGPQPPALEAAGVAIEDATGFLGEVGVADKRHERTCQGLIASSCRQRQIAVAEASVTPRSITRRWSSVRLKRLSDSPKLAGSSQAIALTSATCSGGGVPRALVGENLEPLLAESSSPLANALGGAVEAIGDPAVGLPGGRVEDHPCSLDLAEGPGLRSGEALELIPLLAAQLDLDLLRR